MWLSVCLLGCVRFAKVLKKILVQSQHFLYGFPSSAPFCLHYIAKNGRRGGLMVSAFDSGEAVRARALAGVIVLCSWARYSQCLSAPRCINGYRTWSLRATDTGKSSGLMSHLARTQTCIILLTVTISHVLGQVPSRFLSLDQQGIL